MRKVIAAINITLDGFCDHTAVNPDEEVHQHYSDLLNSGGLALYGRTTFELMKFWQDILTNPTGQKEMDDFAKSIDAIPKIVFSNTIKSTNWNTAELASTDLLTYVKMLKQQEGKDVLVGSRSILNQLLEQNLLDELQLCIHPVIAGSGLPLFTTSRKELVLSKTKIFKSGAVLHYYNPSKH